MNWTVVWQPRALDYLAELWAEHPKRTEIAAATDAVDAELRRNPLAYGEARDEDRRIAFESCVSVLFAVSADDRIVYVIAIRYCGR